MASNHRETDSAGRDIVARFAQGGCDVLLKRERLERHSAHSGNQLYSSVAIGHALD